MNDELSVAAIKPKNEVIAEKSKIVGGCGSSEDKAKDLEEKYGERTCSSCWVLRVVCGQKTEKILQQISKINNGQRLCGSHSVELLYFQKVIVEIVTEKENLKAEMEQLREALSSEHYTVIRLTGELDVAKSKIEELGEKRKKEVTEGLLSLWEQTRLSS